MGDPIQTDAFATGTFKDCERKYDLRINQGLTPKGRAGGGRGFGSALHKGREVWRRGLMSGLNHGAAFAEGLKAVNEEWNLAFGAGVQANENRSLANAEALFRGYVTKFANQNYTPISVEEAFSIPAGTTVDRIEEARESGTWSPNFNSMCKTAYGLCDFQKWCSSTPEIRPQVEQIYYEVQKWQPLALERLSAVSAVSVP